MFSFLNDLENLKQKDYQYKKNYQYSLVHPYIGYDKETPIEEMD